MQKSSTMTTTYFTCNATFFTGGVSSQHVFATETRRQWSFFHGVIDGSLFIKEGFSTYPQSSYQFAVEMGGNCWKLESHIKVSVYCLSMATAGEQQHLQHQPGQEATSVRNAWTSLPCFSAHNRTLPSRVHRGEKIKNIKINLLTLKTQFD